MSICWLIGTDWLPYSPRFIANIKQSPKIRAQDWHIVPFELIELTEVQFWLRWVLPVLYRYQWPQLYRGLYQGLYLHVQGAAGTQQGELAHALKTGTSRAPQSSMEPNVQLHLLYLTVVLHYTPTQQLRQEKLHFTTYAKHYSSLRKSIKTFYWLYLHLEQTFG